MTIFAGRSGVGVALMVALSVGAALPVQARNWADEKDYSDLAASKKLCQSVRAVTPPAQDRPDAKTAATLAKCESKSLYYGLNGAPDPVRARQCAFLERDRGAEDPFAGAAMLMMIYANGVGAKRDLTVALALACTLDGAPAELDGRALDLDEKRRTHWNGTDFSWCDAATSGVASGYCSALEAEIAAPKRAAEIRKLARSWANGPAAKPLDALLTAAEAFFEAHASTEVSRGGTGAAAMMIGEKETLATQFLEDLKGFASGKPPCAGAGARPDPDKSLNETYRRLMRAKPDAFESYTGITQEDVRRTQRVWLKYRDAWSAFATAADPTQPAQAVTTWLTERRVAQLRDFVEE